MEEIFYLIGAFILIIIFAIIFIGIPIALFRWLWRKGDKK